MSLVSLRLSVLSSIIIYAHLFHSYPPQGSGKTLAYGLPILHYLLSQPRPHPNKRRPVRALILAPTRELAMQVSSHLNECLNPINKDVPQNQTEQQSGKAKGKGKGKGKEKETDTHTLSTKKPPPHVSVAAIVGGMSSQKQRRILDRGVDVLVATPGRLWDIIEDVRPRHSRPRSPYSLTPSRMTTWPRKSRIYDSLSLTKPIV